MASCEQDLKSCDVEMLNKLVEIPANKWPVLRDLYTKRKDRAACYNLLQSFISWKNKEPELELTIYSLNGDWEADGTFIAKFLNQIFFNTCSDNVQQVLKALKCLDPSEYYVLSGYQDFLVPVVKQYLKDCGFDEADYNPTSTFWYHIPKEQAKQFQIDPPNNIVLKPLEECHVEQINNMWSHRLPYSVEMITTLIRHNESVGIFEDDNLVGWCLIRPLGSLGLLRILDTHKRRGLGNLAVRYLSKFLADNDIEVAATVVFDNVPSCSMFDKLGFKVIDKVYWVDKPANK
ncbi:uncharacterized protein LOC119599895 isoform X1 [Lucilia sericata]|uniref:uncharacterized protein LOC119599895 isoform X1 n=2 Tax=Lucilia sericata TaxID=13632 RepID=UPI0018A7F129|nr:uncharacterized protein LOC119599895 isoform X1 [Lucilia sericata]XP_037805750.1 uncharacterized protein LOC119599895 isoform X1 [Lucilia sericata]XP_037805751.1 uncharacterized protein LOC119599895 isoform X1 [Lucilia sericata]